MPRAMSSQQMGEDNWFQIKAALENEKWDFRTVNGISNETGIDPNTVKEQLVIHESDVRKSINWNSSPYEDLYTFRPVSFRELIADAQALCRLW